jgi:hypothetical protein
MPHYMMDLFYREVKEPDGVRKDSCRIRALSERGAFREAEAIADWRRPTYFHIRRIVADSGDCVIYKSNPTM